jgi:hypothetical protein
MTTDTDGKKVKGKVRPRKGNEGSRWGRVFNATLRPLYLQELPGSRCIGGWVSPRAALDEC